MNFEEWDGLVNICFQRKNKTLAAIFKNKSVLELLNKNYEMFCAMKDIVGEMRGSEI